MRPSCNELGFNIHQRSLQQKPYLLRIQVSSQPEVTERKLDSRDKARLSNSHVLLAPLSQQKTVRAAVTDLRKVLVLASDGVWDHVSSQEAWTCPQNLVQRTPLPI